MMGNERSNIRRFSIHLTAYLLAVFLSLVMIENPAMQRLLIWPLGMWAALVVAHLLLVLGSGERGKGRIR